MAEVFELLFMGSLWCIGVAGFVSDVRKIQAKNSLAAETNGRQNTKTTDPSTWTLKQKVAYAVAISKKYETVTGRQFEELVASVFKMNGYRVQLQAGSNDGGIDVIATSTKNRYIIQCKRHRNQISLDPIRSFATTCRQNENTNGIFISFSGFTNKAKNEARYHNFIAWDFFDLLKFWKSEIFDDAVVSNARQLWINSYYENMSADQKYFMRRNALSSRT